MRPRWWDQAAIDRAREQRLADVADDVGTASDEFRRELEEFDRGVRAAQRTPGYGRFRVRRRPR